MIKLLALLDHWQTLLGSLIGGVFALLTAWVVAWSALRTARRTAGTLLLIDLLSILSVAQRLESKAKEDGVSKDKHALWVSKALIWRRPRLSSSYDAYVANLVGVHNGLSAHLSLLKMVYSSLDDHLARIEEHFDGLRSMPRSPQVIEADAAVVASSLTVAAQHAACAEYFINQLVLGRMPAMLKHLRMRLWSTPIERRSKELLSQGI